MVLGTKVVGKDEYSESPLVQIAPARLRELSPQTRPTLRASLETLVLIRKL